MKTTLAPIIALLTGLFCSLPARALETDQFYAWGKPLQDSTAYLNAWVQLTVQSALDAGDPRDCESAIEAVQRDLQHSIYQPIELWILSSDLVDRIPRGVTADRDYRAHYLLSSTFPLDYARALQPSPTLEIEGVRLGSDKLAHFFSEGWWYYKRWRKEHADEEPGQLQRSMFEYGVTLEQWIQGMKMTGIFSPADLEANYQGLAFYRSLCRGEQPLLYREGGRWRFSGRFDFRDYVSPEWDESWNPNIYSPLRWKSIRKTMEGYCPQLHGDWVSRQRAHYASLDTLTPTEALIRELVAAGEIPDPREFDITAVCDHVGTQ